MKLCNKFKTLIQYSFAVQLKDGKAVFFKMSCLMTKPTKWHMRPAKTQISLGIHPVWSESSLCAQWVAKDPSFLHSDSKVSEQTGRMPRLIWVFAGRTLILLVLSCCGSNLHLQELEHDKTDKLPIVTSEDSDQPGHQPNLIRVYAMCFMAS